MMAPRGPSLHLRHWPCVGNPRWPCEIKLIGKLEGTCVGAVWVFICFAAVYRETLYRIYRLITIYIVHKRSRCERAATDKRLATSD